MCSNLNAQTYYKSEKLKISFTSYEILEGFLIESTPNFIGFDNDNLKIHIIMSSLNEVTKERFNNLEYAARNSASLLGLKVLRLHYRMRFPLRFI